MAHYVLLNDPASHVQHLLRTDHISVMEIRKEDHIIKVSLVGGQELTLTHEESKQLLHYIQGKMNQPTA